MARFGYSVVRGRSACRRFSTEAFLRRGIDGIGKKEREAWPENVEGFRDSTAYLASLESASREMLERWDQKDDPAQPEGKMVIELVLSDTKAFYAIYDVRLAESSDGVQIEDKEVVVLRDASRGYLSRTMRLMVASAFHIDDATARVLLSLPESNQDAPSNVTC